MIISLTLHPTLKSLQNILIEINIKFSSVPRLTVREYRIYECSNKFLQLMKSCLNNRTQVVSLNSKVSGIDSVKCSVPQGPILGPLLFLIFVNDLPLFLSDSVSTTDLYADDTTVYDAQFGLNIQKSSFSSS